MRALAISTAVAISAVAVAPRTSAQAQEPKTELLPERLQLPGLPNLAHVEGSIYRGGRPQLGEGGAQSLAKLGIKKVIDLQGGDFNAPSKAHWPDWTGIILRMEPGEAPSAIEAESKAVSEIGGEMINIPIDSLDPISATEAEELERIMVLLGSASPAQPFYVHCEHGKDRTGLVLALYRVRYDGWSAAKASAEMAEMGHTGRLDELFTGNMDVNRVLAIYPALARPAPTPPGPASVPPK